MIKKIVKIKNLGIFGDYQCDSNLPEFKRYNLIYGWNGSGKTTLSHIFTTFETGKSEIYPDLEFKVKTDQQGDITQDNPYNKRIRVFNEDYIAENIDISSCKAKPILILGKENKELAETIRRDEKILFGDPEKDGDLGKIKELELKNKELDQAGKQKGALFTNVAKIISTNTSGVIARNYRKNNAEESFSKLSCKHILTDEEIHKYSSTLKQQEKPIITELELGDITEKLTKFIYDAKLLLESTVETIVIDRLKENPDISLWVEQGLVLHTAKNSLSCEFCNQPLPATRITELLAYFNDADKKLKDNLDILLSDINQIYATVEKISFVDKANLYDELQSQYLIHTDEFSVRKIELLASINLIKQEVENKKTKTTVKVDLKEDVLLDPFITATEMINIDIGEHNSKSKSFDKAKEEAIFKLENHYLSEIFDDVKNLESIISKLNEDIDILENGNRNDSINTGIIQIKQRISENRRKLSNSGIGCEEINKQLKTFLGRDELSFEVAEEGYLIKRKGKIAKNLSEGEKTAIAFVYFTIHLKDQDFQVKEGIVVIDDPISSLDSNSLFQAFAFLKNAVKDSKQVFILTHNFDFLGLLLNWLAHHKMKPKSEFFMIKNFIVDGERVATIAGLDPLLQKYQNEYHYLFSLLYGFESDGTIAKVYHIPNVSRKVLEYFLMIMIPNDSNPFEKLEKIEFDENKKTAIYKFTNDQSHITGKGFDPSLIQECQNCVKYLLEMMEKVFPAHYKIMTESIGVIDVGQEQVAATQSSMKTLSRKRKS